MIVPRLRSVIPYGVRGEDLSGLLQSSFKQTGSCLRILYHSRRIPRLVLALFQIVDVFPMMADSQKDCFCGVNNSIHGLSLIVY